MADGLSSRTTFLQKLNSASSTKKVAATGGGLSAAALIYLSTVYATKVEVDKISQAQTAQWRQIGQLNSDLNRKVNLLTTELNEIKGRNAAYEMLLRYIKTGAIQYTNAPELSSEK
jgi:hypothetical protein